SSLEESQSIIIPQCFITISNRKEKRMVTEKAPCSSLDSRGQQPCVHLFHSTQAFGFRSSIGIEHTVGGSSFTAFQPPTRKKKKSCSVLEGSTLQFGRSFSVQQ
ncbi:hypothetical protein VIGAN_01309200, partial [Vigna angularis var. angularis]